MLPSLRRVVFRLRRAPLRARFLGVPALALTLPRCRLPLAMDFSCGCHYRFRYVNGVRFFADADYCLTHAEA